MNNAINYSAFQSEMKPILSSCVGKDYAHYIVRISDFVSSVKQNVEETSAWQDEGYYTDDDIRLAIGRILLDKLGIEYT